MNSFLKIALPLLALGLTACSSPGPMPADGVPEDDEVHGYRERFADDLRGLIQMEAPRFNRTPDGLLKVSIPLRNVSGDDLTLLAQLQFLDATQAPNGDETNRQLFPVPRGMTKWFQATSRTSDASDYMLHLWRSR